MFKDSIVYLFVSFFSILIGFVTLPFFTEYLGLEDFGLFALFVLFGSVVVNVISFGLQTATQRYFFQLDHNEFSILNTTIFFSLITLFFFFYLIIILPLSDWISFSIFDSKISAELLMWSFISGCFHYFYSYFNNLLIIQKRALHSALISILHVIINTSLVFYFIKFKSIFDLALIYSFFISNAVIFLLSIFLNLKYFQFSLSFESLKKSFIFSSPSTPVIIINNIYHSFDKTMMSNYHGKEEIGYYEFGSKFAIILKSFMDAVSKSWVPFFMSNAEKKSHDSSEEIITRYNQLLILFAFVGLGVSYFTEEFLILLTNPEFYDAKYLTPVLVVLYFSNELGFLSIHQLIFAGKLIYNIPTSILGLTVNIVLNIILIPKYGAIGAVIATAIASFIMSLVLFYFGNKSHPLPIKYKVLNLTFSLFLFFNLMIYPIFYTEMAIFWKIILKVFLLCSFLISSIWFKLISADTIKTFFFRIAKFRI